MYFWSLYFELISILVLTFYFYHFESLNQLTRDIYVLTVSQLKGKAKVADKEK